MLLKKSEENIKAASVLHNACHYNCAAHSAYYSCFQLMMFIDPSSKFHKVGKSSHEKVINFFKKDITSRRRALSYDFWKNITKLKKAREEADYSNLLEIDPIRSDDVIKSAESVSSILKNAYNI